MRKMIEGQKGITLISLVITMIIIFILVGATLAIAVGDGGLIDAVKESRKDQQTEILKVKLGIIAQNWSTQKVLNDNITLDDLFNDLIEAGIIKNKEEGIIGPDENGNYEIVTPDGLIFDLIVNEDGSITIEEQTNGPRILSVAVEKTSTSITVKPVVKNLEDGTYTYSYKKSTEANYTTDSANTNTKATSCTYTGLTEGALYNIKIQVQNAKGQDEYIVNVKLGGLASGTISVTKTTWANEKATIELATTEQGVIIQYQLGTLTEEWNDYVAPITNLNHGDTIYVRIYNGTVGSTGEGTITVTDSNPPQAANIVFSKTTADVGETITATVNLMDNESGINGTNCKWVYNKIDTKYDEENSIWDAASSFTDTTPLQLAAAEEGTYYLHVLSVDKGGNKKASISEGVVVEGPKFPVGWDETKVTAEKSADGITVPVPIGFVVSSVANENKVKDGLVIYEGTEPVTDSNVATARETRNQFVWVPVPDPSEMYGVTTAGKYLGKLYSFESYNPTTGKYDPLDSPVSNNWKETNGKIAWTNSKGRREPDIVIGTTGSEYDKTASYYTEAGIKGITTSTQFKTQLENEFKVMCNSVTRYKGFFIGRYETGSLHESKAKVTKNNSDIAGRSADSIKMNWYKQYQMNKEIIEGKTSMIWGCQWDACIKWFLSLKETNLEIANYLTDRKGNYKEANKGGAIPTGSNEEYGVNNIYDMAGNISDWTIEANDTLGRSHRRWKL